jgi:hypothetical protein
LKIYIKFKIVNFVLPKERMKAMHKNKQTKDWYMEKAIVWDLTLWYVLCDDICPMFIIYSQCDIANLLIF